MKYIELEITHKYKGKFLERKLVKVDSDTILFGSSRAADVRLMGEKVSGIHASIEYIDNSWLLSDLGSDSGTWVNHKSIVSHRVSKTTKVIIGPHEIFLKPQTKDFSLFKAENKSRPVAQSLEKQRALTGLYHQVIVRKNGFIVAANLLQRNEKFEHKSADGTRLSVSPPSGEEWVKQDYGDFSIQQRLVASHRLETSWTDRVSELWDPNLRKPLLGALLLFGCVVVFSLMQMSDISEVEEKTSIQKLVKKNRYAKIIVDAKVNREKRKKAIKLKTRIAKQRVKLASTPKVTQNKFSRKSKPAPKVISRIKAMGLSRLVGKISKRASRQAKYIHAVGASPEDQNSGRALASLGSYKDGAKNGSKSFHLNGIKTKGLGGAVGKMGALKSGSVGNASVGIIEEETEVNGGLDRDVIARVIKSQIGQIRYCYERQLSAHPELYGKVLVKFTIGSEGSVTTQKVNITTLDSAMVEGCILRRIAGWKFPEPKGGASVRVTYPFLFKSSN